MLRVFLGLSSSSETPASEPPLPEADRIMKQTMFLGTYPGLTGEQIDFMVKVIRDFVQASAKQ